MLTKILFTAAVILVVALIFRNKSAQRIKQPARATEPVTSIPTPIIAYIIIGLIVATSGFFYFLHWQEEHQVLRIKVINGTSGKAVSYKAMRMMMDGRRFETLDGRSVTLGESDRIEILEVD